MTISSFTSRLNPSRLRIMLNYPTKHGRIKNHRGIIFAMVLLVYEKNSDLVQVTLHLNIFPYAVR